VLVFAGDALDQGLFSRTGVVGSVGAIAQAFRGAVVAVALLVVGLAGNPVAAAALGNASEFVAVWERA
jgi:hypothetical protein